MTKARASITAQQLKPRACNAEIPHQVQTKVLAAALLICLPANAPGKATNSSPSTRAPATQRRKPRWSSGVTDPSLD